MDFFLFLIISCQKTWSNIEVNNFLERCENSNLFNLDKEEHLNFCQCILEQSLILDIPYSEFLKKELNQDEKDQIIMVSDKGQVIRVNINQIRIAGRTTQGVSLFKIPEGDKIVYVSRVEDLNGK